MKSAQAQEKPKLPKNKGGRPSKQSTISLDQVEKLAGLGLIDTEVAYLLDISEVTLKNYKNKNHASYLPGFLSALKKGKLKSDKEVAKSLFERACGYSCEETKVFCNDGELIEAKVIKHYPPDPTSMIFWLKNRRKDLWRDKTEVDHGVQDEVMLKYKDLNGKELLEAAREVSAAFIGTKPHNQATKEDKPT